MQGKKKVAIIRFPCNIKDGEEQLDSREVSIFSIITYSSQCDKSFSITVEYYLMCTWGCYINTAQRPVTSFVCNMNATTLRWCYTCSAVSGFLSESGTTVLVLLVLVSVSSLVAGLQKWWFWFLWRRHSHYLSSDATD